MEKQLLLISYLIVLTSLLDTLCSKETEILGSTSPLRLDSLRCLDQRWFSPRQVLQVGKAAQCTGSQALTLGMPYPSWINPKFGFDVSATEHLS
jgi:hypothetical protein